MWFGWTVAISFAQDLDFDAVRTVPVGSSPSVSFRARVAGFVIAELTCSGRQYKIQRNLAWGDTATLSLDGLPVGAHACTGSVRFELPDGSRADGPLALTVEVLDAIAWAVSPDDLDLAAHTLVVNPSRPLRSAQVELRGVGGAVLAVETATLVDPAHPTFRWTTDEEVLMLVVTGEDQAGIRGTLELSPWSYAIPHEDVVFASGSHDIASAEAGKLERCWGDVERVLGKYGSVVQIELFVAGYTDTVGDRASNQALSERRARSIARWFVSRGFPGAVRYQGFGEDVLAVATPDETDQPANRRALYLLAAQRPATSRELPRDDWRSP